MAFTPRIRIFAAGALIAAVLTIVLIAGEAAVAEKDVAEIIDRMSKKDAADVWKYDAELAEAGVNAKEPIKRIIDSAVPKVQVVLAHRLFVLGETATATRVLSNIVTNRDAGDENRTAAVGVLSAHLSRGDDAAKLAEPFSKVVEPLVQVAVHKFLFEKTRNPKNRDELKRMLSVDDFDVRSKAALALAETGDFDAPKQILTELSKLPTPDGRLASALINTGLYVKEAERSFGLSKDQLVKAKDEEIGRLKNERDQLRLSSNTGAGSPILDEILYKIRTYYVDDKSSKEDQKKLIDEAARGMAESLDRFSSYLDEKEWGQFNERMSQNYSGIGAVVTKAHKNDFVTIDRPIYSGPAYAKGLKYGDQIAYVNDCSTVGIELDKVVENLKGLQDSDVRVGIYPRGSAKVFHITVGVTPAAEIEKILAVENGSVVITRITHSSWSKEAAVEVKTGQYDMVDVSEQGFYATAIGAFVTKSNKNDYITAVAILRGSAAWNAGLRDGDFITKLNGIDTIGMEVANALANLREKVGTPLKLAVFRRGDVAYEMFRLGAGSKAADIFKTFENKPGAACTLFIYPPKPTEVVITRRGIMMPSVFGALLPGGVGYILMNQFGEKTANELLDQLIALKAAGMKSLIFDLRGNPGGYLETAVKVVNFFITDKKLIVCSKGRNPIVAPRSDRYSDNPNPPAGDIPVVVLVNKGSASASEIVSGALQDHKRAVIMGVTTFGKGSVQQLMEMNATGKASRFRITTAKYFLPSGRSIHEVGVTPDIVIDQPEIPGWQFEEIQKLRESEATLKYVNERFEKNRELFKKLAENDRSDTNAYPDFDAWYKTIGTKAEPDYVRWLLRQEVRRRVMDDRGKEFSYDYVDDTQLQRAIVWCMEAMGKDMKSEENYKFFADKFVTSAKDAGDSGTKPETK